MKSACTSPGCVAGMCHPAVGSAARCPLPPRIGVCRRSAARAALFVAAAAAGGGRLVDPSAGGRRLVAVPQRLDPSRLADIRQAEAFGPRGLLLVGMPEGDGEAVRRWLQEMEPGFAVSCCPAALLASGTLRQAVYGDSGAGGAEAAAALPARAWEAPPPGAPPVAFFSGLSGEEQVALIGGWEEHTGLQAPAFASVTPGILDKPLSRLLSDIVRAQAQQPPPGLDPEDVAGVQAAAAAAAAAGQGSEGSGGSGAQQQQQRRQAEGSGGGGAGGEQALRSKLADYVMLGGEGQPQGGPMSLDDLKQQIQDKMRQKKAAAAAADKAARREAEADETDRLREALRSGKKAGGGKGKKARQQQQQQQKGSGKGFGA